MRYLTPAMETGVSSVTGQTLPPTLAVTRTVVVAGEGMDAVSSASADSEQTDHVRLSR